MSRDLNKVQLTGHLGADPETKYTPQGNAVTTFRVASNRRWRTADNVDQEATEWFRVVAWNKLAEICAQYLRKGSRVYIEGRLQTRSWDDQSSGQKRYMTEVIASDMIMLDSRRDSMGEAPQYDDQDVGYSEPEPEMEAPAPRSFGGQGQSRQAQPPSRPMNNGNGAPSRPAQRPGPTAVPTPRKPVAPTDEDDLPF